MNTPYKKLLLIVFILILLLFVGISIYNKGRRNVKNHETKKEIKKSEKQENIFKDSLKILKQENAQLKKKSEKVKIEYVKGKERIQYITKERIIKYTDSICKKDVLDLKDLLSNSDSLIELQNKQIKNQTLQLITSEAIIKEKDQQINHYKNQKPKIKPLGIGIVGGYGTDLKNGLAPFVGAGISYNLIRL